MRKYLLTAAVLLSLIFGFSFVYIITQKGNIVIDGPDSYTVGELVTLDASASRADELIWKIIPPTDNFKVFDRMAIFSSIEPIDYTVVVIARYNRNLDCQVFPLPYKKEKGKVKIEKLNKFEQEVKTWLVANQNKDAALRLAQSFRIVARTIDSGVYETVDDVILATAWANSDALGQDLEVWKPFLEKFQNYLQNNPPNTVKEHTVLWKNMATALKKIFNAKT